MTSIILLVLLGLMGTVYCSPICPKECEFADRYHHPHFTHVLDLQHSSVAPWNLTVDSAEGREPQNIQNAVCKDCTVEHMIAKPIYLKISVYQMVRNDTAFAWCKCPYKLAVGCTCVKEKQQ